MATKKKNDLVQMLESRAWDFTVGAGITDEDDVPSYQKECRRNVESELGRVLTAEEANAFWDAWKRCMQEIAQPLGGEQCLTRITAVSPAGATRTKSSLGRMQVHGDRSSFSRSVLPRGSWCTPTSFEFRYRSAFRDRGGYLSAS
jgi:hypothetical protein